MRGKVLVYVNEWGEVTLVAITMERGKDEYFTENKFELLASVILEIKGYKNIG